MREPATGSARDRLEKVLDRLADREAEERVFLKLYPDPARVVADAADARSRAGISFGPLDGRIVSIKNLFDVAGETTTAGSAALFAPNGHDRRLLSVAAAVEELFRRAS
jgi:aspartyl-tRNA(Asn)/glutamyl-tRNA(Gln) amidotransferase subunit A